MSIKRRKKRYHLKKWVKVTFNIIIELAILFVFLTLGKKDNTIVNTNDINELRIKYDNDEVIAKLVIPEINLETVLTKTDNNDTYLEYNAYKKIDSYGNPFIDYRNDIPLDTQKQINIYGHNIRNEKLPFSKLEYLLEREIFDSTKYLFLYTDNNLLVYNIYAIKVITKVENEHMRLLFTDDNAYEIHLNKLLENTKYCRDNCNLDIEDDILVIQTCNFKPKDTYIIVIAKKIYY